MRYIFVVVPSITLMPIVPPCMIWESTRVLSLVEILNWNSDSFRFSPSHSCFSRMGDSSDIVLTMLSWCSAQFRWPSCAEPRAKQYHSINNHPTSSRVQFFWGSTWAYTHFEALALRAVLYTCWVLRFICRTLLHALNCLSAYVGQGAVYFRPKNIGYFSCPCLKPRMILLHCSWCRLYKGVFFLLQGLLLSLSFFLLFFYIFIYVVALLYVESVHLRRCIFNNPFNKNILTNSTSRIYRGLSL